MSRKKTIEQHLQANKYTRITMERLLTQKSLEQRNQLVLVDILIYYRQSRQNVTDIDN